MTVSTLLKKAYEITPNKVFIKENKNFITYSEMYAYVKKISKYLNELEIKKGSRVAIYSNKHINQVTAVLSILSTDYIMVPISNLLKLEQVEYILNDCDIKCIITDDAKIQVLEDINYFGKIISMDKSENTISFPEIIEKYGDSESKFNISSNNNAAIIYSSGSTGFPKGIVASHKNLFDGARTISSYLELDKNDIISGILSFNFDYGLNQIYCTLYKTATLALHNYLLPNNFYTHLINDKVTILPLMPVFLSRIFDEKMIKKLNKGSLSNVRLICSSGGKVTSVMIKNIKNNFINSSFYSMYGLTEAFRSSFLSPEQIDARPTSIGKAIPDVELYVIDEEGNECNPNEIGELIHRGGCVGKGYWNRPEDTKERFKSIRILEKVIDLEGQLVDEIVVCSGDYVYKDEEGYIYFISRKDEMIKSSGYRISPYEIENSVYTHVEDIKECAIFSIEDEDIGQKIVMAYTSDLILENSDIQLELKKYLPNYMIPTVIYKLDKMPVTSANQGKINKKVIKQTFLNSLG